MNRRNRGIAFLVSAIVTIGLLMITVGKPKYMEHCEKHCHKTEIEQPIE